MSDDVSKGSYQRQNKKDADSINLGLWLILLLYYSSTPLRAMYSDLRWL